MITRKRPKAWQNPINEIKLEETLARILRKTKTTTDISELNTTIINALKEQDRTASYQTNGIKYYCTRKVTSLREVLLLSPRSRERLRQRFC